MRLKLISGWIGFWLGWQIESNWTHPLVYALLSILRPISASLILVFIYLVVIGGDTGTPQFAHLFVGQAFFLPIGSVLFGISFTIHEDRDHYQMFRYIYLAPGGLYTYLLGRGGTRLIASFVAVAVNLGLGVLVFDVPLRLGSVNIAAFAASLLMGIVAILFLGILLAGFHIVTARHSFFLGEALAGLFYLLCGCIYALEVLPPWAQAVGKAMPFTYWFSALRRSLGLEEMSTSLAALPLGQVMVILAASTAAMVLLGHLTFKVTERWALRTGRIDMVFNY